jgi:hypothetical protein
MDFHILKEAAIRTDASETGGRDVRFLPGLLANYGIFLIGKTVE